MKKKFYPRILVKFGIITGTLFAALQGVNANYCNSIDFHSTFLNIFAKLTNKLIYMTLSALRARPSNGKILLGGHPFKPISQTILISFILLKTIRTMQTPQIATPIPMITQTI